MAKKTKTSTNALGSLFYLLALLLAYVIYLTIRLVLLTYDAITIYSTKYKVKSGNGFFKTYFNKGNYGEFKLYRKTVKYFGKQNVFANLYLAGKNTENTEIDVLAVSPHGIYVFEMKNFRGYIYGNDQDETWTQVFNRRSKYKFYNPLRQNYAHTRAVENYLGLNENETLPVIVFANQSKLQKITINSDKPLVHLKRVLSLIKKNRKTKPELYTQAQISDFNIKLLEKANMPEAVKAKHIAEVQALQAKPL